MAGETPKLSVRWAGWWIRRNPTYLLSAVFMAVGARLYLVEPRTRAGDIGVILLTLGVLQAYEWAVSSVLLALHRWRRSPEDEPSLLLISALFWTGPLAATREMAVHRPHLGLLLAVGACAIAMAELRAVRRLMGLRVSLAGQLAAGACVLLPAASPPLLIVPEAVNGTNEVFLYLAWWVLAAIALMALGTIRSYAHNPPESSLAGRTSRSFHIELAFLVLVLGATAAHLAAMNYAFFGHAQWFYASPLIVAAAVVVMDYLARVSGTPHWALAIVSLLPAVAVALANGQFDEHMPVRMLPRALRDPLLTTLLMAAVAWWFGYRRHHRPLLLHAGNAALAWAVYRGVVAFRPIGPPAPHIITGPIEPTRDLIVLALYALTAYLVVIAWLRRSRVEGLAAVLVHQAALTLLVWGRTDADVMILILAAGWSWLIGLHLAVSRPSLRLAVWPVAVLITATWLYDFDNKLEWIARLHALGMVVVLLAVGLTWQWTRYHQLALCVGTAHDIWYSGRWILNGENPTAAAVVIGAFVLLTTGAVISWYKASLLEMIRPPARLDLNQDEGETALANET
jgi:hypothetical protein